jgi:Na+/proline symporter
MWSVAITDAIQIGMVLVGLILLLVNVLSILGEGALVDGWNRVITETPSADLVLIPTEDIGAFMGWMGIFVTGALGNVPVQDLMQRVFASNSERTARRACIIAGIGYLTFGAIPIFLALATRILLPDASGDVILLQLARTVFTPAMSTVFMLCVLSAVASTIDSAILSPSTVLAQNVFGKRFGSNGIARNRLAIVVVTAMSILFALSGESAYALLEQSYELTLVGLFLPLMIGIYVRRVSSKATLACMLSGTSVWLIHVTLGADQFGESIPLLAAAHVPRSIGCTIFGGFVYLLARRIEEPS